MIIPYHRQLPVPTLPSCDHQRGIQNDYCVAENACAVHRHLMDSSKYGWLIQQNPKYVHIASCTMSVESRVADDTCTAGCRAQSEQETYTQQNKSYCRRGMSEKLARELEQIDTFRHSSSPASLCLNSETGYVPRESPLVDGYPCSLHESSEQGSSYRGTEPVKETKCLSRMSPSCSTIKCNSLCVLPAG